MPKTYAQFMTQIDALKAKADVVRRKEATGAIKKLREAIAFYGLSAADLGLSAGASADSKSASARMPSAKTAPAKDKPASAAKYRDDAGHTWTGMGPKPGWLKAAIAEGRSLEDFAAGSGNAVAVKTRSVTAKKAVKSSPKAKYGHEGKSWSGRGPQPRWLKEALSQGKTLDDLRVG